MHRFIENHLEEALAPGGLPEDHAVRQHLKDCLECRVEVDAMREHSELLRGWKAAAEMDPRPGFYARVWDRIEAQRPVSIWGLFTDSLWGRGLAVASLSVALLAGGYVISSEQTTQGNGLGGASFPVNAPVLTAAMNSNPNAIFMDLVSYRGQ